MAKFSSYIKKLEPIFREIFFLCSLYLQQTIFYRMSDNRERLSGCQYKKRRLEKEADRKNNQGL